MEIPVGMLVVLAVAVIVVGAIIAIAVVSARKETVSVAAGVGSYFDGNTWQLIGYRILSALVNTITLGIAYPWMLCMVQRWEVKHTVIHGRRLKFNGHGHQLIGKYLLWVFLIIITFGIYGIWLGLGMKKWVVKHTVYADEEKPVDSYFSGGAGGYLGIHILSFILTLFTFGIGKAWADKMVLKWEARHTHIGGSPLEFNGTGGQLFVKYLLLVLLTPLTLGIYALFFTVIYKKWEVKHTEAVYQTPEIQAKAKAHELTAVQDFAKYRIAANDQEIAAIKSGYTGKEDVATLEQMAEDGNPFAAYHLAKQLKGGNALYEDKALGLLQKAADGKVHSALLDLAKQSPTEQKVSILTEAAQCGNAEASWLLMAEYKNANNLPQSAYWFKVAMEWGAAEATARTAEYDEIVKDIALQLSENRVMPQQSKVLPIVLGVVGAVLLAIIAFGVMAIFGLNVGGAKEKAPVQEVAYDWDAELKGDGTEESPYIIETAYDFQKYMLYSGENYGVITEDFDICTDYLFYGSNESNFDYFEQQVENGYIRFQNEDIEVFFNGMAVRFENRINLSDISHGNTDTTSSAGPSADFDTTLLVGDWVGWNGSFENAGGRDLVPCVHMSFSSDGTFSAYEMKYVIMDDGSYMESTTRHIYGGDYRIDEDTLILHYTYFNSGNPDERDREATTTHKIAITDNKMQVNNLGYYDAQYTELYKGMAVKEVVEYTQSQKVLSNVEPSELVGEWVGWKGSITQVDWMGDGILSDMTGCLFLEFFDDGTFTDTIRSYFIREDTSLVEAVNANIYCGTYTLEGNTLTLQYTHIDYPAAEPSESIEKTETYTIEIVDGILHIDGLEYCDKLYRDTAENVVRNGVS